MDFESEYCTPARYKAIQKHLDSLGYSQSLPIDALPLVEALLADLIKTTESLKHFKSIAHENIETCCQLQSTVDPYKCDNARLIRECNELHEKLIAKKEVHQKQVQELRRKIHKLESDFSDLQSASSRYLQRIKDLEIESSKKSKKILELQGKCSKPFIKNVGLSSKKTGCDPLKRPEFECEPLPKSRNSSTSLPSSNSVEPKVVDLLNMADHRMNCLSHEVTKLKEELSTQTDITHLLRNQLTMKEKEIIRLRKLLEGGRPHSAISKDFSCKSSEKLSSRQNTEVCELKVLQQTKSDLEHHLKEALSKQHEAMAQAMKLAERNEQLEKELKDIDHIALAVEADCNTAVKENNKRVSKLQEKLENVMTQVHVLENELIIERRQVQELRADLEACKLEKRNIQHTLETTLEDKKHMTDKINKLTIIEKSLNDKIETLSRENDKQKQEIIHLEYTNKRLTDQLHISESISAKKNEITLIEENNCRSKFYNGSHFNGEKTDEYHRISNRETEITKNNEDILRREVNQKNLLISDLQNNIRKMEADRDYYRNEYNKIKGQYSDRRNADNVDVWTRVNELQRQLDAKDRELSNCKREKEVLCREKFNLEMQLQNFRESKKRSYSPCKSCNHCIPPPTCSYQIPLSARTDVSSPTKVLVDRLQSDRDAARADVERLVEERDALRERHKMTVEMHNSEQKRLKDTLTDVENRLKQIERERHNLVHSQGTRKATINGLEDQLEDIREELRKTKEELSTQRAQYYQLRALQDQTDQALSDVQGQLVQSEAELNRALDHNRNMEQQQIQLENQIKELKQEINTLHSSMAHLDHEKDQLLLHLDEKTEKIASLEREVKARDQQAAGAEQRMRDVQHKNEICVNQCAEQECQLRSLQTELEELQRRLETSNADRENAIQENRRLQDDLASVSCEVRNLQHELEASRSESYELKRQLQTYVSEIHRVQKLLNKKENERTEMLNQFHSLSVEASVLENNNHSLESEAAEARGALQSAQDRLMDLEHQLADRDSLIRGYEAQIAELTQNIASMETQLRQSVSQRQSVEADLTALRDLCVKLDQQKSSLSQELDDKDSIKSRYESQLSRLKAERDVMQDQIERDRAAADRLENLLDQARQESMNAQTSNQELQREVSRLKQKISDLQSKLATESDELMKYQTQAAEYNKQIIDLRRQVTNERFDRARNNEESRRHENSKSCRTCSSMNSSTFDKKNIFKKSSTPFVTSSPIPSSLKKQNRSFNSTPDSFNVDLNVVI